MIVEERIMHTEFCLDILMERSYLDYTQTWECNVREIMGRLLIHKKMFTVCIYVYDPSTCLATLVHYLPASCLKLNTDFSH